MKQSMSNEREQIYPDDPGEAAEEMLRDLFGDDVSFAPNPHTSGEEDEADEDGVLPIRHESHPDDRGWFDPDDDEMWLEDEFLEHVVDMMYDQQEMLDYFMTRVREMDERRTSDLEGRLRRVESILYLFVLAVAQGG